MPTLADYKAPYPEPTAEQDRYVIYLAPQEEEEEQSHMRVQLIPGRYFEDCEEGQGYCIEGSIEPQTIEGWGYDYYTVEFGDLSACNPAPNYTVSGRSSFIPLRDQIFVRYNSKLPIVVYMPKGCELRYKIWLDEQGRERKNERESGNKRGGAFALYHMNPQQLAHKQQNTVWALQNQGSGLADGAAGASATGGRRGSLTSAGHNNTNNGGSAARRSSKTRDVPSVFSSGSKTDSRRKSDPNRYRSASEL